MPVIVIVRLFKQLIENYILYRYNIIYNATIDSFYVERH